MTIQTLLKLRQSSGLSLDELVYLYDKVFSKNYNTSLPAVVIHQLEHMAYLDEKGSTTNLALELFTGEKEEVTYSSDFEEFWATYPTTARFGKFADSRKLKDKNHKHEVYQLYLVSLSKTTHFDIMNSLRQEINQRKQASIRTNEFKYMLGIRKWLETESYIRQEINQYVSNAEII